MRDPDTHPDRGLEAGLSELRQNDPERLKREMEQAPEPSVKEHPDE